LVNTEIHFKVERCPDCDREWPERFGSHNCNFSRRHVHNNSIVVEPGAVLLESVQRLTSRMEGEVYKSAEYANLGGDESPYPRILGDIDATIGYLKSFRAEMQRLAGHEHIWDRDNDHCSLCGADGRG
jgi:hypothetical protein